MVYISVDPSSIYHAVAVWEDGYLSTCLRCKPDTSSILETLETYRPSHVVLEGQWLGRNFASVSKLLESRVRFQTIAEMLGIEVTILNPKTWQAHHKLTSFKGKDLKAQSVITASNITTQTIQDHNMADAINMGVCWYAKR